MKKKTVTLPRTYHPGNGKPKETLAYLSAEEHDLIRRLTDGKWNRGPKGVKSYADDSASSRGVSRGDNNGTKGSGGLGQGGQRGEGGSGSRASNSPSGGVSTGGGMRGAGSNTGPGSGRPGSGGSAASGSSAGSGGQRGAGSNYGPGSGRPGTGGTFGGVAKAAQDNAARASGTAPNAAAQAAFDRQRMSAISNRYDPVTRGAAPNPRGAMAGASPADFARTALGYNINKMDKMGVTDANRIVDGFNNLKQFADVTYDPAGLSKIQKNLGYTPIGIRSNNPGNLMMPGGEQWQKEVPGYAGPMTSPNGLTYQSFTDPRWGMVAQNELLGRYADAGRNTINSVVDRYAPVDQNNSAAANAAYKQNLSEKTGFGLNDQLTREQVQSLGPYKTAFENGGVAFAGGPFGPSTPSSVQVAGIANAGMTQADALARAQRAASAAAGVGSAFGGPNLGPMQGPNQPPQGIPAPNSIGMMRSPYSGYGNFTPPQTAHAVPASAEPPRQVGGMSFTPGLPGQMPEAPRIATDPRVSITPLGSLPAAKPKEIQLAWNVPPMGGAMTASPQAWRDLGIWGTNRPIPQGPAATPGTIHSQTADAQPTGSWKDWVKNKTGVDVDNAVTQAQDGVKQVAEIQDKYGDFGIKMAANAIKNGYFSGAGSSNRAFPGAQDRSGYAFDRPPSLGPQGAAAQQNPIVALNSLLANMVAQGAKPEEIAYVQSLIEELTKAQVA